MRGVKGENGVRNNHTSLHMCLTFSKMNLNFKNESK